MEPIGILAYRNLKYVFYLFLITIGVYLVNTVFVYYINLKVVDYSPALVEVVEVPRVKPRESRPLDHYNKIWERNLFAVAADAESMAQQEDLIAMIDKLALTSLNCTLIGTVINEKGASWAVIRDNQSGRQDKFTVGSTISGANVVMILRNKVVLNRDGKNELLVMGIEKIRAEMTGEKPVTGDSQGEVSTQRISKDFVRESMNNVAQIMSKVRIKPHLVKGKADGFEISRIKDGSLFQTMGFQSGDIIKSVNGRNISSAEDIMKLYDTLKDSSFFSIGIVRKNQAKTLNFKVR